MSDEFVKRLVFSCVLAAAALPGPVAAQAPARAAEPLGRLFFTPAQRARLDVARTQRTRTTLATDKTEEIAPAAPVPQTITYDGAVRRSDGKSTVWLNSRPVFEHDKQPVSGGALVGRVRPDGGVSLQVPQSGRSVNLKPGQSIELLSGAIEEAYSRKPPAQPEAKPEPKPAPDAKTAKPTNPERARGERDREDRERQLDEAARAVRDAATAKPAATAPAETPR